MRETRPSGRGRSFGLLAVGLLILGPTIQALADGANLAAGKPISGSPHTYTYAPANANDNDVTTYFEGSTYPSTLTVRLRVNADLTSVVVKLNPDPIWTSRTQTIQVLGREETASGFVSLSAAQLYTFSPATGNTVTIPVSARVADVRLSIATNSAAAGGQVAEFQVIGVLAPSADLPDYNQQPAFTVKHQATVKALKVQVERLTPSAKNCTTGRIKTYSEWTLRSNVCNPDDLRTLRRLVSKLAPGLNPALLTFWVGELERSEPRALIVRHVDLHRRNKDPYLSLWRIRLSGDDYRAVYGGSFLDGEIHAARAFGTNPERKALFVMHASCLECHPIRYLTAIDFDADEAKAFEFSYSEKHDEFEPLIEYELPGMGHTVDAAVETRILAPSRDGPHLLQFFKMEGGERPDEWWLFSCKGHRCDYQMHTGKPPAEVQRLWKRATRL
jgi:hypothetical protein